MTDSRTELRIAIGAGGTGGHIFPAVAVLNALQTMLPGKIHSEWLGSADRMERTIVPKMGIPYTPMPIRGFAGLTSVQTILLPFRVMKSIQIARRVLRRFKPHVVLTTGAYISYPVGIAAIRAHIPLVIMESNVNIGKTNARLLSSASAVVLAYEQSKRFIPTNKQSNVYVFGNPVRSVVPGSSSPSEIRERFGLEPTKPTVFIMGGSLGARSINEAIQKLLDETANGSALPYQLIWQTGAMFTPTVPNMHSRNVRVMPFVENVAEAYAAADLVVCRSGASTLAELAVTGKPAILVPLPSASMNEQQQNAELFAQCKAAVVVNNGEVNQKLESTIHALITDNAKRAQMSDAIRKLGKPDAASLVAQLVCTIAGAGT